MRGRRRREGKKEGQNKKGAWQQPEHEGGEDADDEEHGVADQHLGQGDLL